MGLIFLWQFLGHFRPFLTLFMMMMVVLHMSPPSPFCSERQLTFFLKGRKENEYCEEDEWSLQQITHSQMSFPGEHLLDARKDGTERLKQTKINIKS